MTQFGFKPASLSTSTSGSLSDKRTHRGTTNLTALNTIQLTHLVASGDRLTQVQVGGRATTNGDVATGTVCLYETNAAGTNEGVPVDVGVITVTSSIETVAWCSTSGLNIDLSAWAGKYIKFAILSDGGKWRRCLISGGASGDMVSNTAGTQTNPFGSLINQTSLYPVYGTIESGAGISDINGGNPAIYGQAVTWTATGFSPNAATVDDIAASVVSASGMTLPALVDGQAAPRPGSRAVVASEGGTSANSTVVIDPPAGFQYVQLAAQVTDNTRATPPEAEPDDHFMVETKNNTIAYPDGTVGTNHVGSVIAWLIKDDTKIAGQYAIIFGEGGEYIETRKISARKIYAEKIKAVKITASRI